MKDPWKSLGMIAAIMAFIVLTGIGLNKATKALEHWSFPLDYSEIVEEKAREYDVPRSVIYAVIKQESRFDPRAESRAGARGLMQIMKITYEWIDYYRGPTGYSWGDMYDPEASADYGVWLLRYLYDMYGDWETVYAAYNAGFGAVSKWLGDPEYSDDGETLKEIPYAETEKYVSKVSSYRNGYRAAYDFE